MNLQPESTQLIRNLFQTREFQDCAEAGDNIERIDVIIPVLHSNDLWKENLLSFYREIPINRLIIGDAGCIDETISIVKEFPRVTIINHQHIATLGSSIADLISRVSTPKFAYLQSDVFLPSGWFSAMSATSTNFAWVGCPMQIVAMLDYTLDYSGHRPLAGAQLGQTSVFQNLDKFIDDDYVYRQEDFILEEYVKREGFQVGNSMDTFHFHQVMRRNTIGMQMNVKNISVNVAESTGEENRVNDTQLYGLLKYCNPKESEVRRAAYAAYNAQNLNHRIRFISAMKFVRQNNKKWQPEIFRYAIKSIIAGQISLMSRVMLKVTDMILGIR